MIRRFSTRLSAALGLALAAPLAAQDAGGVYELSEVETLPRPINPPDLIAALEQNYPRTPRDSAFDGTVLVSFVVGADGMPREAAVVAPADSAFGAATLASIGVLRFTPAMVGRRRVPVRVTLPVQWQFRDEAPPEEAEPGPAEPDFHGIGADSAQMELAGEAVEMDAVEELPRLLNVRDFQRELQREFPELLRDAGVEGLVHVRFVVGVDGRPHLARILRSSTHQFEEPTLRAVEVMRFNPARVNGEPVPVWVEMPITWAAEVTTEIRARPIGPGIGTIP